MRERPGGSRTRPGAVGYGQIGSPHRGPEEEVIKTALPTGVTATRVHEYLSDVAYPATREDLIEYARSAGAPDEIVETLERLPRRRYASPDVVTETIGMVMKS